MKLVTLALLGVVAAAGPEVSPPAVSGSSPAVGLPESWLAAWRGPPCGDRPLQIVHGIDPRRAIPDGTEQILQRKLERGSQQAESRGMRYYLDLGLGGIVCNVAFQNYLRSDEQWRTLVAGVKQCDELGMVVWLYDERGYPSGSAGGLVLQENREFEASELAWDASRPDPSFVRPAYEHTHASNNYHACRRYINLLDDRAVQCFIAKTHDAYWQKLQPYFGKTIQAMFTDEPSLMAVNLGAIPEPARSRVPVEDPVDPKVMPLPCVPWSYDLPQRYQERFGESLLPRSSSLFSGDEENDRRTRRQFWSLVADLTADRYFGALQRWCSAHGIASSGHCLWEEAVLHHVPLVGNGLKPLTLMDIPGLDVLSSNPEAVIHGSWMTAALPCSAARLTGRRRVMTEVSDFSQKMSGAGPAALDEMQATAAWQAAWGVTDFTLYYGIGDRPRETYRQYGDFVGRLNTMLKPALPVSRVLLYYPIHDLWSEYKPVAAPLKIESQSDRARKIVASFLRLGQILQRRQIPFTLVDHEFLASAAVKVTGHIGVGNQGCDTVLLPEDSRLPTPAGQVIDEFRAAGGRVLQDRAESTRSLVDQISTVYRIEPASERIALGEFLRDGKTLLLLTNVGKDDYVGKLIGKALPRWYVLDPATGNVAAADRDPAGYVSLKLPRRSAVLLASGTGD